MSTTTIQEQRREDIKKLLNRLEREEANFRYILNKNELTAKQIKVVEETSFELLERDILPFLYYNGYAAIAKRVVYEIEKNKNLPSRKKNVDVLYPLLYKTLQDRLNNELHNGISPPISWMEYLVSHKSIACLIGFLTLVVTVLIFCYGDGVLKPNDQKSTLIFDSVNDSKPSSTIISPQSESRSKPQIELYFLPFLSEQVFFDKWAASSINQRGQIYRTGTEVDGRTGKVTIETVDVSNDELRAACVIPLYADYTIDETGKKQKKGRNKDIVAHVTFIFRDDVRQMCSDKTTLKKVMFLPPSYNVDTGRWHNELMAIRDTFESRVLGEMFTEYSVQDEEIGKIITPDASKPQALPVTALSLP